MRYTLTGTQSNLFNYGFQDATFWLTAYDIDQSPTAITFFNPANGAETTLLGSNLSYAFDGPISGVVTEMRVADQSGRPVGSVTEISWSLEALIDALEAIAQNDIAPFAQLVNAAGPLTVDLSGITGFVDMEDTFSNTLPLLTVPVTTLDGGFDSDIGGGLADDTFLLRGRDDGFTTVFVESSEGEDTYDGTGADNGVFLEIDFDQDLSVARHPITARIDGPANTATIDVGPDTHTILDVDRLMRVADGISILGSHEDDRFEIATSEDSYINLRGGEGRDSYDLTLDAGALLRLSFDFGADGPPTIGASVNLATTTISNDGFGNAETLDIDWNGGRIELRGTDFADRLTGSDEDDSFRPQRGADTIVGGEGTDRVSYYFQDVAVDADLFGGFARVYDAGVHVGTAILSGIEVFEGSDRGDDTIAGSADGDLIRGRGGNDSISGGLGDDELQGWGDDNLKGGGGNDTLLGGNGRDFLNGGTRRDSIEGGDGNDVLIGRSFDDTLIGGASDDNLNGGGENDRLEGGSGNDFVKGGLGADVFVFDLGFETDRIADFEIAEDRFEISAALADGRSAAQIADLATVSGSATLLDLGNGDVIRLLDVTDVTGLEASIDIV